MTSPQQGPTLDYQTPQSRREDAAIARQGFLSETDWMLAFATLLLIAAVLSAWKGYSFIAHPHVKGTAGRQDAWDDGTRMFLISGVLLAPAIWYGTIAVRRLRRRT